MSTNVYHRLGRTADAVDAMVSFESEHLRLLVAWDDDAEIASLAQEVSRLLDQMAARVPELRRRMKKLEALSDAEFKALRTVDPKDLEL